MEEQTTGSKKKFDLEERLIDFGVRILNVVESLPKTAIGAHVAGQLLRCGTSPVANYAEAHAAESRADFVHKMKVSLKELRETRVWLLLIERKGMAGRPEKTKPILDECNELISIFVASIRTAIRNREK